MGRRSPPQALFYREVDAAGAERPTSLQCLVHAMYEGNDDIGPTHRLGDIPCAPECRHAAVGVERIRLKSAEDVKGRGNRRILVEAGRFSIGAGALPQLSCPRYETLHTVLCLGPQPDIAVEQADYLVN